MNELINYLNSINKISLQSECALLEICSELEVKKNTDLHPIGHVCRNLYFVKNGLLRIYYLKDDIDVTESFEFENAIVARADSLFHAKPSRKAIQAIEDSNLIAINGVSLFKLYDSHPDIERLFNVQLCSVFTLFFLYLNILTIFFDYLSTSDISFESKSLAAVHSDVRFLIFEQILKFLANF